MAALLGALGVIPPGVQAEDLMIPLDLPQLNFFGGGVGAYPDYFGSKDQDIGVAPFGRLSLGGSRFVRLLGNEIRVNLLDNRNWQLGPAALWRFSREDVENPVVNKVHEIDDALSLGLFGGYIWRDPQEMRRQAGVGAWALGDATDVYNGWTAGLNAYAMQPVARMVTLAAGTAFTYGSDNYTNEYFGVTQADSLSSGLPIHVPGGGVRDVRGWATAVLSLSLHWHLGVGIMYSRILGDAADSPLVALEGSKNQWIYGVGALYAW
ncbi:MipA/OmpV family protein [Thiocystis violacea]|uniref:MipA/OmpV family protein n=1 Tax=Thiocystis violacea TaxID=13725 RepID=UPI0019083A72